MMQASLWSVCSRVCWSTLGNEEEPVWDLIILCNWRVPQEKCLDFELQLFSVKAEGKYVFHPAAELFAVLERIHYNMKEVKPRKHSLLRKNDSNHTKIHLQHTPYFYSSLLSSLSIKPLPFQNISIQASCDPSSSPSSHKQPWLPFVSYSFPFP